jgi:CHAT domain-containing protein
VLGVKFAGDEARALDLLQGAYRAREGRMVKADALRSAQLSLISDLRNGRLSIKTRPGWLLVPDNPQFWAGFVLEDNP